MKTRANSTRTTRKPLAFKAGSTWKVTPALNAKGLTTKYDD
jgi:hypothetical protein